MALPQGTNATAVNPTNWTAMVDDINNNTTKTDFIDINGGITINPTNGVLKIVNVLSLGETTTPVPDAGDGKVYTKNDNNLYFQDGAGVERRVILSDYAGIYFDGNAVATTINLVEAFELCDKFDTNMPELISNGIHSTDRIIVGDTGVYEIAMNFYAISAAVNKIFEFFAFEIAASGDVVSGVSNGNPCVITATGHSFSDDDRVKITGVGGATGVNDRIFTVDDADANTFTLATDDGTDVDGAGFGVYASPGTAKLATKLTAVHVERKFATSSDIGAFSASGFVSLTAGNIIQAWVLCATDATNITVVGGQLTLDRK